MSETNVERLERIKIDFGNIEGPIIRDYKWLIKQAEHTETLSKKAVELNVFLQGYTRPKDLGRNVVDVAMDMIVEQEDENKRLREALEQVYELSKHDNHSHYLDKCYVVARQALEDKP